MKKIRSVTQLELEQIKLKLREAELEKAIRKDWRQVKESLKPINIGKEMIKNIKEKFKAFS